MEIGKSVLLVYAWVAKSRLATKDAFWPVPMRQAFMQSDNPDKVSRNYP